MKRNLLSHLMFFVVLSAHAQSPSFQWAKRIGDVEHDYPSSIATDSEGNVYTTGYFKGNVDFDPNSGVFILSSHGIYEDVFVSKLDGNGNFIWAKNLGGSGADEGWSIAVDNLQNVYITGDFQDTADFDPDTSVYNLISGNGSHDAFICKLNDDGSFSWAIALGNNSDDGGYAIDVDQLGNVYTTGFYEGTVDFDPSANTYNLTSGIFADAFINKLDSAGNLVWAKSMGGLAIENGRGISVKADGFVYTMGVFQNDGDFDPGSGVSTLTSFGVTDVYVSKLDTAGNFIWAKQIGGPEYDHGSDLAVDSLGNCFITGTFQGTSDFDPGVGAFNLSAYGNSQDFFVSKLDSTGNFKWAYSNGGSSSDQGQGISVDRFGNVYSVGHFMDTLDFDPGPNVFNLSSVSSGTYIEIVDSTGDFIWAGLIDGAQNDLGYAITVDQSDNIYTTGAFQGTSDFDPGANVFNLTSTGQIRFDIFIQKMKAIGLNINNSIQETGTIVFPNPTTSTITILRSNNLNTDYTILDISGKQICSGKLSDKNHTLDLSQFEDGIYFLRIQQKVIKLIKE